MIKVVAQGNLVSDVEIKKVGEDNQHTVAVFTVASNRPGKDGADFLRVETWGSMAENCAKYLKKGSGVCCSGDLSIDSYFKDDEKRVAVKLVNVQVEFTDRKGQGTNSTTEEAHESASSDRSNKAKKKTQK